MAGPERQPRRWSSAEDQVLREQVESQQIEGGGKDWCRVALELPGRTNKDCRKRWHNSVAEGLRKGQWSRSEDQLLTNGVHCYGHQWTKVATCVSSRSADQCAKRWQQSLDPRLDRSEWREDEDLALLTAVNRLGRHWKDIQQQYLPRRSKNCVKNRYSVLARRTANHLVPSDDSFESSSSEPGTPLQSERAISIRSPQTSSSHGTQQTPYTQSSMISNDMSCAWSGLGDPNVSLTTNFHDPQDTPTWYPQNIGGHNLLDPATQGDWYAMQTAVPLAHTTQYPCVSYPTRHGYPSTSSQHPYPPSHQTYTRNAPPTRQPPINPNLAWSAYQYRDAALYEYHH